MLHNYTYIDHFCSGTWPSPRPYPTFISLHNILNTVRLGIAPNTSKTVHRYMCTMRHGYSVHWCTC